MLCNFEVEIFCIFPIIDLITANDKYEDAPDPHSFFSMSTPRLGVLGPILSMRWNNFLTIRPILDDVVSMDRLCLKGNPPGVILGF